MKNLQFESLKDVKFEKLTADLHKITGGYCTCMNTFVCTASNSSEQDPSEVDQD